MNNNNKKDRKKEEKKEDREKEREREKEGGIQKEEKGYRRLMSQSSGTYCLGKVLVKRNFPAP